MLSRKPSERASSSSSRRGSVVVLPGRDTLEVVGESFHQEDLWRCVGGRCADRVRHAIEAELVPETDNPHDANAILVLVDGRPAGHLCREDATLYRPGLQALIDEHAAGIGLHGHIVGGGDRDGRLGMLGVFLDHDPAHFGLRRPQATHIGVLRTGFSQAVATDLEDDSYDLSWYDRLSGEQQPADTGILRDLLAVERDAIDRHFMLAELAACVYKTRSSIETALDEFDEVCEQHHAEMPVIRPALHRKFGAVPVIDMYRQAAIRCQKARDWSAMRTWAQRGLTTYGDDAARVEAVVDLEKRLAHAEAKLAAPEPVRRPAPTGVAPVETLTCQACGAPFERVRVRGRKPHRCPRCR